MINLIRTLTNTYLEEESVSVSVRPEIAYLPKLIVIISGQSTEDTIRDMQFGPNMPNLTVSVYQNLLKCRRLRNRKPNARWHRIQMRENGGSLDFNFISLPNRARNGLADIVCCSSFSENDAAYDVPIIQTLCERQTYWTFPLLLCTDTLSVYYSRLLTW